MTDPGHELTTPLGGHHAVGGAVEHQDRERKRRRPGLHPGDRRDDLRRESGGAYTVEERIGQDCLHHRLVPGEPGKVHPGPNGEAGPHPREDPAQRHERCRHSEPAQRRGGSDHSAQAVRIPHHVLEDDQSAEAVPQQEQRPAGLLLPDQSYESMQILAVLLPALHVRSLAPGPTVAAEVHRVNRDPPDSGSGPRA